VRGLAQRKEGKMFTLYDYLTHVKGVEYLISLLFMALYILYAEILKPKPFKTIAEDAKDDMTFIGKTGHKAMLKTLGRIVAAPFIGLAYVVALPFAFMFAIGTAALHGVLSMAHRTMYFGWRPLEAYLTGKKKRKEEKKEDKEK
jgi:hypothetical protein